MILAVGDSIRHPSSEILYQPAQGQRPLKTENEEPGTKNQEQPRSGQLQLKLPQSGLLQLARSGILKNPKK
jgi:hypothetical protein